MTAEIIDLAWVRLAREERQIRSLSNAAMLEFLRLPYGARGWRLTLIAADEVLRRHGYGG